MVRTPATAESDTGILRQTRREARSRRNLQSRASHPPLSGQPRTRASEVPVVVFGLLGLADDVGGSRTGEEVVVLIRVRAERGEDRRVDVRLIRSEQRVVAKVHQGLVGVV